MEGDRRDRARRIRADHSIERQTSALLALVALLGLSVEAPRQLLRGCFWKAPKDRGVSLGRSAHGRVGIQVRSMLDSELWIQPVC
jgi:hypothetical protein